MKLKPYDKCIKDQQARTQNMLAEMLAKNNVSLTDDTAASIGLKLASMAGVLEELDHFITQDPFMETQKELIRILAPLDDEVIITGPTGTGKEIFARSLAAAKSGPFLPINCAALNETLIESELFGHKKGAFTDAKEESKGVLRSAENGTVFLDDLDKMSPRIQPKLLRAIQEKEVRPVGSAVHYSITCRFICASKKSADELLGNNFLEDLYGRISTFEVKTTALSQRPSDIGLILDALLVPREAQVFDSHWEKLIGLLNVRALHRFQRWYHVITKKQRLV